MESSDDEMLFQDASDHFYEAPLQMDFPGTQSTELIQEEKTHTFTDDPAPSDIHVLSCGTSVVTLAWVAPDDPVPPENITVQGVDHSSVTLTWDAPAFRNGATYHVACCQDGKTMQEEKTESSTVVFHKLSPGNKYSFKVVTVLPNGSRSKEAVTFARTQTTLENLLQNLGLKEYYPNKLSLCTVLEIDKKTVTDDPAQSLSFLPWLFLKKLMMVNVTARSVKCVPPDDSEDSLNVDIYQDLRRFVLTEDYSQKVNPLDIITALFLCSDGFLQQEMTLKMSMCQFSVPLLLPNCDSQQSTLMLWALRYVVKKYRPHSLSDLRGFVEERIIEANLPLVSFVRLGDCSISKSQVINKLLSNPQQYHDTFIHRDMDCGDVPRKVSNGLVELSWYLPCGNKNIDIFPGPVAVANLRGDIVTYDTQYSFLCQTSTAVFVFFDTLDSNCNILTNHHGNAQFYLVANANTKSFNMEALRITAGEMTLKKSNVILKTKQNDADFVRNLRAVMNDAVRNTALNMKLEDVAHELGILVDEDIKECQKAKENADAITVKIEDTLKFKESQLPLQGDIWKMLAKLEKEECRLRKAGNQNIEIYKSEIQEQKIALREKQNSYEMSEAMNCFIAALSSSSLERSCFLKWMRMNLDNLTREKLTGLREQYKEKCQESSENKEEITLLDRQISNSALGIEHFLREMGQFYEAAISLSENSQPRQQMQHLPRLCAELLLDGFPLELVDGDASNIPLRWVSDVLLQLNTLVQPKNKIMVITVLGVQSTGKSTLLNTMFGVQFAVSSGRCTRGAFMILIKITDSFKEELNCDYLVIIDTEGLKSPELAQLDDSYEHDNELATFVVGLSDVTIINIAMENSTEMKDILQIVVHAFLRMKEVGKKPKCLFVHQNVADVSAHDKNMKDRKLLLEQLNEMTEAAAKMENKDEYKKFTDVLEYDTETGNWYIPGLWHGNPPMAPVNAGYSEAVYDFKKNLMVVLKHCEHMTQGNSIPEFLEWTKSLWNGVKYENFIFSFRNSLVADAYMKLCAEFHKWEWSFKKHMYNWLTTAETKVSNFQIMKSKFENSDMQDYLHRMKGEACTELDRGEKTILDHLASYFEQTEGHVYLVERYREDFKNSAKCLRRELENSVITELKSVFEIRRGMDKLDKIKKTHTEIMEQKVLHLVEQFRKDKSSKSDEELENIFEGIWQQTLKELSFKGLQKKDIFSLVFGELRDNLKQKGSSLQQKMNKVKLEQCGQAPFVVTREGLIQKVRSYFGVDVHTANVQEMADNVIMVCSQLVMEKVNRKYDYHDTYIQEILNMTDHRLKTNKNLGFSNNFELELKLHICANAARKFQEMHELYIKENDPRRCLEQFKHEYCTGFKDLFNDGDQCQRKAEEFTKLCLSPAVEAYISSSLGTDIVDVMLQGQNAFQFSTRSFFQYSILKQLLTENNFENFVKYICSYECYVKEWIEGQITDQLSKGHKMLELEEQHLRIVTKDIMEAITIAHNDTTENGIKGFINNICIKLGQKLIIPKDALETVTVFTRANTEPFVHWLKKSVEEMEESLKAKFKEGDIQSKLRKLKVKPQDELFKRVFGCGVQCPFCKAPCEAGGQEHTDHCASIHRPQGLGQYRWVHSNVLLTDICSTSVNSETQFKCLETGYQYHPYKKYREIFPNWHIPADPSIQAADYWKYVMANFNEQFAKKYNAKSADIPPAWKNITKQKAEKSLEESFIVK
ncbi:interferon-induced very large GTPase 1-like isoform X2 [Brachyhypopomus gauderio]|uniref:interferon-induced very large GTPase 1-like isoform X2 n=1 Tax=Brachyhypopomus gauderio TaxID=698409 RepID=UPI00404261A8